MMYYAGYRFSPYRKKMATPSGRPAGRPYNHNAGGVNGDLGVGYLSLDRRHTDDRQAVRRQIDLFLATDHQVGRRDPGGD